MIRLPSNKIVASEGVSARPSLCRQGKTYLLEALARASGGLYFGATQAAEAESLRLFGDALGRHLRTPVPPRFVSWDEAIRYLFTIGNAGLIVLDEFPYLSKVSPSLPSILQREVDRAVSEGTPLRGRANLELVVRPFDYRLAAGYWKVTDARLAVQLHAVVGGTPAYRRFVNDDGPESLADFDEWVLRTVLDPATPLFREARYLLEEEAEVRDTALYHSVLAAVANGNGTRGGIANYIGRRAADIGHHLTVLEDCGLLRREPDVFRSGRSRYRVAEALVTFYQVVMRPQWGLLESGRAHGMAGRQAAVLVPGARAALRAAVPGVRDRGSARVLRGPAWRGRQRHCRGPGTAQPDRGRRRRLRARGCG